MLMDAPGSIQISENGGKIVESCIQHETSRQYRLLPSLDLFDLLYRFVDHRDTPLRCQKTCRASLHQRTALMPVLSCIALPSSRDRH